jgi:protein gp37
MSDKSGIEWTDATWNPVTGCSKVSQGCKNCYALRDWARLSAPRTPPNIYTGRAFTDVQCHADRLDQPLKWKKPRRIFVNSMSDLFHEDVPDKFIRSVFGVMMLTPHHTYQVLTKRPARMFAWFERQEQASIKFAYDDPLFQRITSQFPDCYPDHKWPPRNVWLGVSVEDQATADERVPLLLQTPAAVRWISAAPLLGPIDIGAWTWKFTKTQTKLDWVVVGGESGPKARPMHPDWVRSLRDQCKAAGVPFFFKQWGEYRYILRVNGPNGEPWKHKNEWFRQRVGKKIAGRELDGRTWNEYPVVKKP